MGKSSTLPHSCTAQLFSVPRPSVPANWCPWRLGFILPMRAYLSWWLYFKGIAPRSLIKTFLSWKTEKRPLKRFTCQTGRKIIYFCKFSKINALRRERSGPLVKNEPVKSWMEIEAWLGHWHKHNYTYFMYSCHIDITYWSA